MKVIKILKNTIYFQEDIYIFFSLKFIPRNTKCFFSWIELSLADIPNRKNSLKKGTQSSNNLAVWEHVGRCYQLRVGADEKPWREEQSQVGKSTPARCAVKEFEPYYTQKRENI